MRIISKVNPSTLQTKAWQDLDKTRKFCEKEPDGLVKSLRIIAGIFTGHWSTELTLAVCFAVGKETSTVVMLQTGDIQISNEEMRVIQINFNDCGAEISVELKLMPANTGNVSIFLRTGSSLSVCTHCDHQVIFLQVESELCGNVIFRVVESQG